MFHHTPAFGQGHSHLQPQTQAQHDLLPLKTDIERLLMISEALWQILKEKHGYTDDELIKRVALIDLKDGVLDGRVSKTPPADCPSCRRALSKRHSVCIYCGQRMVQDPFGR